MNIAVRQAPAAQQLKIVDCDIHPVYRTPAELHPFMSARWREHMATFGTHFRHGLHGQLPYPRMMAAGMRLDSFPDDGPPGSDLDLMRRQHLDANGVEVGMLIALSRGGMEERNLDFGAALSSAINDWQLECWVKKEPRLRAAIVVPQENADHAVTEIEKRAGDPAFVQVMISPRSSDPLGHRRYWPIYAAAERCGKPLALHVAGYSGGHSSTSSGWPTFYIQEHYAMSTGMVRPELRSGKVFSCQRRARLAAAQRALRGRDVRGCDRRGLSRHRSVALDGATSWRRVASEVELLASYVG